MQERLIELQRQRGRLLERIANQRHVLSVQARPVARTVHVGDRVAMMVNQCKLFVLEYPLVVVGLVGAIVLLRPASVLRWTRRGFVTWRTWTALRSALPGFMARYF